MFGAAFAPAFCPNLNFFFVLLKLSAVCTFWIVLMCWCQKWFLKNKKTSLACISARKAIWKTTTTTLPNTLFKFLHFQVFLFSLWVFSGLFWKLIFALFIFWKLIILIGPKSYFIIIINVNVQVNLCIPQLISQVLKLTIM